MREGFTKANCPSTLFWLSTFTLIFCLSAVCNCASINVFIHYFLSFAPTFNFIFCLFWVFLRNSLYLFWTSQKAIWSSFQHKQSHLFVAFSPHLQSISFSTSASGRYKWAEIANDGFHFHFQFFFYFCQVMEKDQRLQIRRKKMHSSPRVLLLRLNRCRDSLFLVVSFLTRRSDQCEVPDDQQLCVVLLF